MHAAAHHYVGGPCQTDDPLHRSPTINPFAHRSSPLTHHPSLPRHRESGATLPFVIASPDIPTNCHREARRSLDVAIPSLPFTIHHSLFTPRAPSAADHSITGSCRAPRRPLSSRRAKPCTSTHLDSHQLGFLFELQGGHKHVLCSHLE